MPTETAIDTASKTSISPSAGPLLICLPDLSPDTQARLMGELRAAFAQTASVLPLLIAATEAGGGEGMPLPPAGITQIQYRPGATPAGAWTLTPSDFLHAQELAVAHQASALLLLGTEAQSLSAAAIAALAEPLLRGAADLAVADYDLPPRAGLVNSAILYPVSRALFAARPRFPLALDLCLSRRMIDRLAAQAQQLSAANQTEALLWPVAEAAVAGYSIAEVSVGTRALPSPPAADLNALLAQVAGSLFGEVDRKATYWQRARPLQARRESPANRAESSADADVDTLIEGFRLAYTNLSEIWSLVLPPQSLLALKRLASHSPAQSPQDFRMGDSLWARIVYDFILAFRLRTINRGHLLGALTPLYLAWVASHLLQTADGLDPEAHIQSVAAAFEADKPYLVSRWRWPDRFNP